MGRSLISLENPSTRAGSRHREEVSWSQVGSGWLFINNLGTRPNTPRLTLADCGEKCSQQVGRQEWNWIQRKDNVLVALIFFSHEWNLHSLTSISKLFLVSWPFKGQRARMKM